MRVDKHASDEPNPVRRAVSTVLIVVVLGAIALWGIRKDWDFRLPRSRSLPGQAPASVPEPTIRVFPAASCAPAGAVLAEIRLASDEAVDRAGIDVAAAWIGPVTDA